MRHMKQAKENQRCIAIEDGLWWPLKSLAVQRGGGASASGLVREGVIKVLEAAGLPYSTEDHPRGRQKGEPRPPRALRVVPSTSTEERPDQADQDLAETSIEELEAEAGLPGDIEDI